MRPFFSARLLQLPFHLSFLSPILLLSLILLLPIDPATAQTTPVSNGPYGGYVQHLASDSSGRVYAATFMGGIFRTSDDGDTWEDLYDDTLLVDVRTLALGSGGTIYAGLDPGFMRSTDAGATWQKMSSLLNTRSVVSILILPNGHLLASTLSNGIYRSTNGGSSFAESNDSLTNFYVWSLAATPSGDTVFAATYGGGMFRSVNNGMTWSPSNNGLTQTLLTWVGLAPDGSLFACAGSSIFRSTDYGDSWTDLSPPSAGYRAIAFAGGTYYAAVSGGVYASTDGGTTWNPDPGAPENWYLTIHQSNGTVFAGAGGRGVYRRPALSGAQGVSSTQGGGPESARTQGASTQGGWTQAVQGMANTIITSLAFDTAGVLFAGTRFAGVFRSSDSAATWESSLDSISPGEWINDVAVNPVTNTVFATGIYGSYRSTDGGNSWSPGTLGQTDLVACNGHGTVISTFANVVHRSTDDGMTWSSRSLPGVVAIRDLAFADSTVYAATGVGGSFGTSRGVWRSTDDGQTWAAFNDSLTDLNVIAVAARDTASAFKRAAGRDGRAGGIGSTGSGNCDKLVLAATWSGGLHEFDNSSWAPATVNPGSTIRWSGFYVPREADRMFLAGDRGELAERDELTCDWNVKLQARLYQEVECIVVLKESPSSDRALYGTTGGGVINFITHVTAAGPGPSLPDRFALHQNYPNPFNPSTTIRFDVPAAGWVSLRVFDILGREAAVLLDGIESPGRKEVVWDAANAAAGVYFLRLDAGGQRETRTMVLMK